MERCKICGSLVPEDDWIVCEHCRDNAKILDTALEIGDSWREDIEINGFYHHCFSQQDIDDILYAKFKSLPEEEQQKLISEYCEEDMLYFVRWLVKQWKEEK